MATRYSFELKDEIGQTIKMEEAVQGRHGEAYNFEFEVNIAVDKGTGKVTGIREYQPMKIVKPICNASPIIFQKLCEGKKLKSAIIRCYRHDLTAGDEKHFYTIELHDVSVVSQKDIGPDVNKEGSRFLPPMEEIHMIGEKVVKIFEEGHISYQDEYRRKNNLDKKMPLFSKL